MPTLVQRYVDTRSAGGDGTTPALTGAQAAYVGIRQGLDAIAVSHLDLVTLDEMLAVQVAGAADFSADGYTWPAFVTDATHTILIHGEPLTQHRGKYDPAKYHISSSSLNVMLDVMPSEFRDVMLVNTNTNLSFGITAYRVDSPVSGATYSIRRVVVHALRTDLASQGGVAAIFVGSASSRVLRLSDVVVSGGFPQGVNDRFNGGLTVLDNVTSVGPARGLNLEFSGNVHARNVIIERGSGSELTAILAPSSYTDARAIITDDASSPVVAGRNLTAQYIDKANWDLHLDPADTVARGQGVNLTGDANHPDTVDIDGDPRPPTGAWDIGADQVIISTTPLYPLATLTADGWGALQFGGTAPARTVTGTGVRVEGVPSGWMARLAAGVIRPASAFTNLTEPSGGPDATLKDGWRTEGKWNLDIPAGDWTFDLTNIASAGAGADIRYRVRLWTSPNADGSGATERSTAVGVSSAITDLTTSDTVVTATVPVAAINASAVYLFLQVAVEVL